MGPLTFSVGCGIRFWRCILAVLFLSTAPQAATVETIDVPSPSMHRTLTVTVILPTRSGQKEKNLATVYLLHGFGGDHRSWPRVAPLDSFADGFDCLFVCPDAEQSWYVDSPLDRMVRFETFIIGELIPCIDKRFRTRATASGRAITGSSMGGHGALTLLAKHQDLFCCAGSIAGIMDLTEFPREWGLRQVFGEYTAYRSRWKRSSALHFAGFFSKKDKTLRLDCGTEDFALAGNRKMHTSLNALGVAHEYRESPGGHDARFVRRVAREHLLFLIGRMKSVAE